MRLTTSSRWSARLELLRRSAPWSQPDRTSGAKVKRCKAVAQRKHVVKCSVGEGAIDAVLGGGEYLGVADLLIAPYLPLSTRTDVGSWTLVPFGSLEESGVVPDDLKHPVERLVDEYRPTDNRGRAMGVVAVPQAGFGESFERAAMGMLGYALLAGVVTANQPLVRPEEDQDLNAGFAAATSENALLYGHPLVESHSYAIGTGMLVHTTAVRHASSNGPLQKD
jgi:hypothetical protein